MTYDPYAPPREIQPGPQLSPMAGAPAPWNAADAIGRAWEIYKAHALLLSLAIFVTVAISEMPAVLDKTAEWLGWVSEHGKAKLVLSLSTSAIGWLVSAFIQGGVTNMMLKAARGASPSFADAFGGGRWFLRLLAVNFLTTIAVVIGFLLLIVPGIIVSLGLILAPYFVVDQEMGPIEAMGASWESSKGQKGDLFLLSLLSVVVLVLGFCVFGVGVFVALPVVHLATSVAYMSITGRGAADASASASASAGAGAPFMPQAPQPPPPYVP